MTLISPIWYARLIVLAVVAATLGWAHHHIYGQGWHDRDVIAVSDEAKAKRAADLAQAQAQAELDAANAQIREQGLIMSKSLTAIRKTHQEENDVAHKTIERLRDSLRAGSLRLSVPTTGTCHPASRDPGAGSSSGDSDSPRADILPATADALVGLAGECDAAVRRANAAVDAYNAVKASINSAGGSDEHP